MNQSFLFIFFFFLLSLPCFHASRITPAAAPSVTSTTNSPNLKQGITQKYSLLNGYLPWTQPTITYALSPFHTIYSVSQADVEDAIRHAFAQWAAVIPLKFVETDYYIANIRIAFYGGDQHDGEYSLDGPMGTMGWGSGCLPNCEIHLDAYETWTIDFRSAMSLYAMDMETVMTHEIGHLLGLRHSSNPFAVMYATLPPRIKRHLILDDILRAQAIYGANPSFVFGSSPRTNLNPTSTGKFGFIHGWHIWVLLSVFCVVF